MRVKPVSVPRVDWFRLLMDLKRAGLGLEGIALRVEVSKSAVIGWKNLDAEPRHTDGERLIALWAEMTGHATDRLPLQGQTASAPRGRPMLAGAAQKPSKRVRRREAAAQLAGQLALWRRGA